SHSQPRPLLTFSPKAASSKARPTISLPVAARNTIKVAVTRRCLLRSLSSAIWVRGDSMHVMLAQREHPPLLHNRGSTNVRVMVISPTKQVHANPVYGSYFADPFVWKFDDVYYAIGTGELEARGNAIGKVFPLLQSTDFYQWTFASSALIKPDPSLG